MNEMEFWQMLLSEMVAEGLLTVVESSEIIKQLTKEVSQ